MMSYSWLLATAEGEELRRSVLVRNALMTAAVVAVPSHPSPHSQSSRGSSSVEEKSTEERWSVMARRGGLDPSDCQDQSEPSDSDDEEDDDDDEACFAFAYEQTRVQVQVRDYYSDDEDDDDIVGESQWFDGLLREVSAESERINDDGAASTMSLTQSLPSLIIDDDSSGDEDDEREHEDEGEANSPVPAKANEYDNAILPIKLLNAAPSLVHVSAQ